MAGRGEPSPAAPQTRAPAPRILFVCLTNNVGSERMPGAMISRGVVCAVLGPTDCYCALLGGLDVHFSLPRNHGLWLATLSVRKRLAAAVACFRPHLVLPLDDAAVWLLCGLVSRGLVGPALSGLLRRSLGDPAGYPALCSRILLVERARALGVRVPDDGPQAGFPLVVKKEHTCGGGGVTVVDNADRYWACVAPEKSLGLLVRHVRTKLRRALWDRAGFIAPASSATLAQGFVEGRLAMCSVAAWEGQVLDCLCALSCQVHPIPLGASTILDGTSHPEMEAAARRLIADLRFTGFASFDFILADGGGEAFLIEMNPRAIGSVHLAPLFGHDLCAALVARLLGVAPSPLPAAAERPPRIALFPKELERDPDWVWRQAGAGLLHDVPWSEPAVLAAYLKRLRKLKGRAAMTETDRQFARAMPALHAAGYPARFHPFRIATLFGRPRKA